MSEQIETVIIGAGQAGLSMSYHLSQLGREHIVLERGRIAERWRSERWDSLAFQFPNWMMRLPGYTSQARRRLPEDVADTRCALCNRHGPDLIGGQMPAAIALVSDLVKQHQSGKLTMLAVFGPRRSPAAPDVPTFQELGFAIEGGMGWHAFHTTAGTPRPAIDRLSAALAAAIKSPKVSERLVALGLEPVGSTPDELARRIAEDIAKWGPAVKVAGFRADE